MVVTITRGEGTIDDGRIAVELEVVWGEHRQRCVAAARQHEVCTVDDETVAALAEAATWIIEQNGTFGRKGIRLPLHDGVIQVIGEMVDEARHESLVGPGQVVLEFDA